MTTAADPVAVDYAGTTDDELLDTIITLRSGLSATRDLLDRTEHELVLRMEDRKAKALAHATHDVRLDYGTPKYDVNKVRAELGEIVPPDELGTLIEAEHEETVVKPERVDGRKARSLIGRYGPESPQGQAMAAARLPSVPRLVVKEKKPNGE